MMMMTIKANSPGIEPRVSSWLVEWVLLFSKSACTVNPMLGTQKFQTGARKQCKSGYVCRPKAKNFSNEDVNTKIFNDWGFNSEAGKSSVHNTSTDAQSCASGNIREEVDYVGECGALKSVADKYTQVESSVEDEEGNIPPTAHDHGNNLTDSVEKHVLKRSSSVEEHVLKRSSSVGVGFGLVKRFIGWRMMKFTQKRDSKRTGEDSGGEIQNLPSEIVVDQGHPCKKEFNDAIGESSWDDELLVGKRLTQSLSVTEARNGTSTRHVQVGEMPNPPCAVDRDGFSDSLPHVRRTTKKVGSVDFEWQAETKDLNKIISVAIDQDKLTCVNFTGESKQDRLCGSLLNQLSYRKKFHGCSKVWDRMCANPFRGFVQKSGSVLIRSLLECWHESRKEKNREAVESYNEEGAFHRNSHVSVRNLDKPEELADTSSSSLGAVDSNLYGFHSIWKRKKNLGVFAHGRSIQYSSPSSLDNGLLRFYLTPIRYNRRCSSRNTRRNPHYFL